MSHPPLHSYSRRVEEMPPIWKNQLDKGIHLRLYRNGDETYPGKTVTLNKKQFRTFESWLSDLSNSMKLRNGAIWRVYTPTNGTRKDDFSDFEEGQALVVAGQERFKPLRYDQITPTERKRSPPFNYNADPVSHSRMFVSSGKINKCETHSILIKVWPNGGDLRGPRRVLLTPRVRPFTLPNVMAQVNEMLKEDCLGTVEKLYFLNGVKVSDVDQITQNGQYVACRRTERFKRARYNEQGTKNLSTSPRLERKFLAPLYPRSDNGTSQSSPEHSNASTQNSVNSYTQRRKAPRRELEEDQVFPAKPVKHTRSSEKVRTVDLDKDRGGVFKAKNNNRNTRGAREIQDSRHTKTDLPVDQREAREVEEERVRGKDSRKEPPQRNGYPRGGVEAKPNSKRPPPANEKPVEGYAQQREQSATKIQASYRGYKTRKELNNRPERKTPAQNGHLSPNERLRDEDKAAAKIQAGYRGHQTRKEVERKPVNNINNNNSNNNNNNNNNTQRSDRRRSTTPKKNRSDWDQEDTRDNQLTKSQPGLDEDQAAARIQAGYRGYQTRKDLRDQRSGARPVSDSPTQEEKDMAASRIQAGYRGHQARQGLQGSQASLGRDEDQAAAKIQAGFRGHQTRQRLKLENEAATKIQAGYRGHSSRNRAGSPPARAAGNGQPGYDEEQAAAKIQAGYRGYVSRQQLKQQNSGRPVLTPQDTYDELDRENDAALKIQSHYRGYRTRQELQSQRQAAK